MVQGDNQQTKRNMKDIMAKAAVWVTHKAFRSADREEIEGLIEEQNWEELQNRFFKELEFGTGGLRGIMRIGPNGMNHYNVARATRAFAKTLKQEFSSPIRVLVSFDSRINSPEFANLTAQEFEREGVEAMVMTRPTPLGILTYGIRKMGFQGGVMITASHNPKKYNGYKVYWASGAQVTPPWDKRIIEEYMREEYLPVLNVNEDKVHYVNQEELEQTFIDSICERAIHGELCGERGKELKIIYTPLHGTGGIVTEKLLKALGPFDLKVVDRQRDPDGLFPTLVYPNPEEPEALKMAVDMMKKKGADIVYGTDPDTDRIGIVVNHNDAPVYLNGNQIAVLMLHYVLANRANLPSNPLVLKTIVTSPMQEVMCEHYKVRLENTLTGFKWMAEKMRQMEEAGEKFNFVFASEESFGVMTHELCRDKDALGAMALASEMALHYKVQGKTLVDALDDLYEHFGFFQESLLSLVFEGQSGQQLIEKIMETFRREVRTSFAAEDIEEVKDYLSDNTGLPKSNVLGLHFKSGNRLYLRPSGTEPKIKFYTMVRVEDGELAKKKSLAADKIKSIEGEIKKMIKLIKNERSLS